MGLYTNGGIHRSCNRCGKHWETNSFMEVYHGNKSEGYGYSRINFCRECINEMEEEIRQRSIKKFDNNSDLLKRIEKLEAELKRRSK